MENKCCSHDQHGVNVCVHVNGCGGAEGDAKSSVPIGHILAYMGTAAPENYLICDGADYGITDYPKLCEHIKNHFESVNYFGGDGIDTFAVPDLRGEFLRGAGTAARDTGSGENVGAHQIPTMVPHIGGQNEGVAWTADEKIPEGRVMNQDQWIFSRHGEILKGKFINTQTHWDSSANLPISYTIRPTNTAVLYCIKYA